MMTSPPPTNGSHGDDEARASAPRPSAGPTSAKTQQHQIREIHRLVDDAMEDLEQVVRALRFLEKDG